MPCAEFDVVQLPSDWFALQIHPVLCGGELSAVVGIVHVRDGLGAASQDYAVLDDLQDDVKSEADETLAAWAARRIEQDCKLHACRSEHYGVQPEQVREIYRRFWIRRSMPTRLPIWQPVFHARPLFRRTLPDCGGRSQKTCFAKRRRSPDLRGRHLRGGSARGWTKIFSLAKRRGSQVSGADI